jgi:hypothetical protein
MSSTNVLVMDAPSDPAPTLLDYETWYDEEESCFCARYTKDLPDAALEAGCRLMIRAGVAEHLTQAAVRNRIRIETWKSIPQASESQ